MVKLFKYIKMKDWAFMLVVVALIVLQVWLDLKIPDYTVKLTTFVQTGTATKKEVLTNGGIMIGLALGSLGAAIVGTVLISNIASSFSKTLREELFTQISKFSNNEMNQFSAPSLITRTTNDVNQMQNFVAMGVQMIIKAPILAVWAILKNLI